MHLHKFTNQTVTEHFNAGAGAVAGIVGCRGIYSGVPHLEVDHQGPGAFCAGRFKHVKLCDKESSSVVASCGSVLLMYGV